MYQRHFFIFSIQYHLEEFLILKIVFYPQEKGEKWHWIEKEKDELEEVGEDEKQEKGN